MKKKKFWFFNFFPIWVGGSAACSRGHGGGFNKSPPLSTMVGGWVKKGQKTVHVVCERPPN